MVFLSFFRWISGNYLKVDVIASFCIPCSLLSTEHAVHWCCMVTAVMKSHETKNLLSLFCIVTGQQCLCVFPHYILELLRSKVFWTKILYWNMTVLISVCYENFSFKGYVWSTDISYHNGLQNTWFLGQVWNLVLPGINWLCVNEGACLLCIHLKTVHSSDEFTSGNKMLASAGMVYFLSLCAEEIKTHSSV